MWGRGRGRWRELRAEDGAQHGTLSQDPDQQLEPKQSWMLNCTTQAPHI